MKAMRKIGFILLLSLLAAGVEARVRLPHLVCDGVVLQRDVPVRIWGFADPGEAVTVRFDGQEYRTTADEAGDWRVTLPAQQAGGPYVIRVNELTVSDVLFGDVWLCAGQSNMELPVSRVMDRFADQVRSYENERIRHIKIPTAYTFHGPQADVPPCAWKALTQADVMDFSAVAYFFARRLYESTGVPVGLVNASVGGSTIESWMSEEALRPFPEVVNTLALLRSDDYIRSTERLDNLRRTLWHTQLNAADPGCGRWQGAATDDGGWARCDLFDRSWARDAAGRVVNGSVWLRRRFSGEGFDTSRPAILRMGCLTDADSVFVNGTFVGTTSYMYPPRIYTIPAGVLRKDANVVAVRLISYSGPAGAVEDKPYKIVQDKREVSLAGEWRFRRGAVMPPLAGEAFFRWRPTALYNAMLAPLFGTALKGIVWYQGESNTGDVRRYAELLPRMAAEWREGFGDAQLPLLVVQLPGFMRPKAEPSEAGWAEMREVQRRAAVEIPRAALAVTIDAGEWNDIHPLDKQTVGDRLSLAARRLAYGQSVTASGPVPDKAVAKGGRVVVSFTQEGGAPAADAGLRCFAVAGADRRFVWAEARSEGGRVVLVCDKVAAPKYIRYAWADNPEGAALRNAEGIPASPFEMTVSER